ncbi:hypothetical protein R1flu_021007 [Riccia fluitans]|uniref:tRNA dimethylallyltransferase n=1 Tax=Riccia fluitans TaxID=41844 RepID=A0ABD1ZRU2_9MARC
MLLLKGRQFAMRATAAASCAKGRVIVITGPTGVGKSSAAIALAKRLGGEIISADSVQVYKGLDVGSAKTPISERQNVPHHLIDIVLPSEEYSAGDYYMDARAAADSVLARGHVPIVVGGTGLYLRWFLNGKPDTPKPTAEQAAAVDAEIAALQSACGGWDEGVKYLSEAGDPETAQRLARNDWYRLRRSLEILKISGRPQSSFPLPWVTAKESTAEVKTDSREPPLKSRQTPDAESSKLLDYDFQCYFMNIKRVDLYRRIDQRCEEMLTDPEGLLREASWLLDLGILPNSSSPSRAIGYRQTMEYLTQCRMSGGVSTVTQFLEFLQEFQRASRNYAKRQLTWFRGEDMFRLVDASKVGSVDASKDEIVDFMEQQYLSPSSTSRNPTAVSPLSESEQRLADKKELKALKTYITENRIFTNPATCADILRWIERTQGGYKVVT